MDKEYPRFKGSKDRQYRCIMIFMFSNLVSHMSDMLLRHSGKSGRTSGGWASGAVPYKIQTANAPQ